MRGDKKKLYNIYLKKRKGYSISYSYFTTLLKTHSFLEVLEYEPQVRNKLNKHHEEINNKRTLQGLKEISYNLYYKWRNKEEWLLGKNPIHGGKRILNNK